MIIVVLDMIMIFVFRVIMIMNIVVMCSMSTAHVIMIIPGLGKAAPRGRIFLVNIRNMDEMTISLMN